MGVDKYRKSSRRGSGRDPGSFIALPWCVIDSPRYKELSHTAKSLLIEFARQFVKDNNGKLLASSKYLSKRGWNSAGVIQRAKKELLQAGFIYETVKGHRPNKASWYAITWHDMAKHPQFDSGAMEGWRYVRGSYAQPILLKNNLINPVKGIETPEIELSNGVTVLPAAPLDGPIKGQFQASPTPPEGNHLDMPSTAHC